MDDVDPGLRTLPPRTGPTSTVLLVLHGGTAVGTGPVHPARPAHLRMLPIARAAHRAVADLGAAVWVLRNRVRGWNEPDRDPVTDARWALQRARVAHPAARLALIGHSMGGRAALQVAGDPGVTGVLALAPWTTADDPVWQLAGRRVRIVHGDRDRIVPAASSAAFAGRAARAGAEVDRHVVTGSGHAMLRRAGAWHRHVHDFALARAGERSAA